MSRLDAPIHNLTIPLHRPPVSVSSCNPPRGHCLLWHKDASLSAHISLDTMVAAGGLAALSASILPSISQIHEHTLPSQLAARLVSPCECWGQQHPSEGRRDVKKEGGVEIGDAQLGTWAPRQPDVAN